MKKTRFLFLLVSMLPAPAFSQSTHLQAIWDDGLKFENKEGTYKFAVGGRVHYDAGFLKQPILMDSLFEKITDNVEVRRARLSFTGSIEKTLAYEFEFTFGETIKYADMYFALLRVPGLDRVTVGHFREPFGMEELTSSNAIVFMERSLTSAFGPSRNTGIMLQRQFLQNRLKGYAGVFRITDDLGTDILGEGKHSFTSRWVYQALIDTGINKALHLGVSMRTFTPENQVYEIKTRNATNISPNYMNSGEINGVRNVTQLGGELGYSKNRLCLQSEYVRAFACQSKVDSIIVKGTVRNYYSFFIAASYFLKGGVRKYNQNGNRFSSVSLARRKENDSRSGAWEVGLRFSHMGLDGAEAEIKAMSDATAGLNWYFNSNTRLMMNYVLTRLHGNYLVTALQFRIQLTF